MSLLVACSALLWASCATVRPRQPEASGASAGAPSPRSFLIFVEDVPVAEVTASGELGGGAVTLRREGNHRVVTLRHRGNARLSPLPVPKALHRPVVFFEEIHLEGDPRATPLMEALAEERYDDVWTGLEATGRLARDDVSLALVRRLGELELAHVDQDRSGHRLLVRFLDELTSGQVGAEEHQEAQRILATVARRRTPEAFAAAALRPETKVVPYQRGGLTQWSDALVTARPLPEARVKVSLPVRTFGGDFREETRTLPGPRFELPDDEIVGVKLYDEGGEVYYAPALVLVEVSNADEAHTLLKLAESAGYGLALGAGVLVEAGVEASALVRVLAWCDRATFTVAVLATVLDEHRGWILSRFGENGRAFLRHVHVVNSAAAFYGVVRLATAAPRLVLGFRNAHRDLKARAALLEAELSPRQHEALRSIASQAEEFLRGMDDIRGAGAAHPPDLAPPGPVRHLSSADSPGATVLSLRRAWTPKSPREAAQHHLPAVKEEPLAATGTAGRLVEIPRRGLPASTVLASAGPGGGAGKPPPRPGPAPAPPRQAGHAAGEGQAASRGSSPVAEQRPRFALLAGGLAEDAADAEVLALKFAQAEWEVVGPRYPADSRLLEKLRPSKAHPEPDVEPGDALWDAFVDYFDGRHQELRAYETGNLTQKPKPPLVWREYRALHEQFWRGETYERSITAALEADAALPRGERALLGHMETPVVARNAGVRKQGSDTTYFADQLIVDEASLGTGKPPLAETCSNKSHDFRRWTEEQVRERVLMDKQELLKKYKGRIEIRRRGHPLYRQKVEIKRAHLFYEEKLLKPEQREVIKDLLFGTQVEVHFK